MSIESMFNSRCDIERATEISDSMGGHRSTWSMLHQNVLCYLTTVSGMESIIWSKLTPVKTHIMYCQPKEFTEKDRVKFNGSVFDIVSIRNPGHMNQYLRVELRQIEGLDREREIAAEAGGYGGGGYGV